MKPSNADSLGEILLKPEIRDAVLSAEEREYKESLGYWSELLLVAQLLANRNTKFKIRKFHLAMEAAEQSFERLDELIENKLKFLLITQPVKKVRREQDDKRAAAA